MTSDIEHKCIFFRELPFASSAVVLDLFLGGSKVFYLNCLPEKKGSISELMYGKYLQVNWLLVQH